MAKTSKPDRQGRQAVADKLVAQQRNAERTRGLAIVGVCVLVAVLIVALAAYSPIKSWWDKRDLQEVAIDSIGAPASACQDVTTKEATGNQEHVAVGTALDIQDAPPAFGQHYDRWEPIDRRFYQASDRPELGKLIHNLEHGYTILWYDETAAADSALMTDIEALADKFGGDDSNYRNKFKAAPWTESDGKDFPKGQHVAYTHWSVGGTGDGATGQQVGVWQYCTAPSGAALETFMDTYPYTDSPEPDAI